MDSTLVKSFAVLLQAGLNEIRRLEDTKEVSKEALRLFKTSVSYNIRWMSLEGTYDASEAAMKLFEGKYDLHKLTYKDQIKAEKTVNPSIKKRTLLKLEHKTCVSDIFERLMECDRSLQTIQEILESMQIVWVLVQEDKKLKVSGRGDAHDEAYAEAGIVVRKNPNSI